MFSGRAITNKFLTEFIEYDSLIILLPSNIKNLDPSTLFKLLNLAKLLLTVFLSIVELTITNLTG
jgi:hypothetical protein